MGMPDESSLGGPAACEPPFVSGLRRIGVDVVEQTYVYGEQPGGTTLSRRVSRVLASARRLRRRLLAEQFDLLHLNSSFDSRALLRDAMTLKLFPARRAKLFIKFHGSDADLLNTNDLVMRRVVDSVLSTADGIGVLSSEEKENFTRAGISAQRLFVVKNVVSSADYSSRPAATLRGRLGISDRGPLLLFIARFIPAKGLLDVIRACAMLRDRGQEFHLLCVGDGPARSAAEAAVSQLNLRQQVHFFGYIPEAEANAFYRECTMLVFPTYHFEGFPMVVFKAVAEGLPIITTRIRAARDYLQEPGNCLFVEARNPAMLMDKIMRLLNNPDLGVAMADNNRRLSQQFTAAVVAREYLQVYNQLTRANTLI